MHVAASHCHQLHDLLAAYRTVRICTWQHLTVTSYTICWLHTGQYVYVRGSISLSPVTRSIGCIPDSTYMHVAASHCHQLHDLLAAYRTVHICTWQHLSVTSYMICWLHTGQYCRFSVFCYSYISCSFVVFESSCNLFVFILCLIQ